MSLQRNDERYNEIMKIIRMVNNTYFAIKIVKKEEVEKMLQTEPIVI